MSFSNDIKKEIALYWQKKSCCRQNEALGMILFCNNNGNIMLKTKSYDASHHLSRLLKKCYNITAECDNKASFYYVKAKTDDIKSTAVDFLCENCKIAFIRGAFLCCGQCTNPQKDYQLEFNCTDEELSYYLCKMLISLGIDAKTCEKSVSNSIRYSIYVKNSASIEDLLTIMGAQNCSLSLMESKIMKDVRNNINRKTNFETANIKKSSESCARQLEAIKKLEKAGKLNTLPEDLQKVAKARQENIDISLSELGKCFDLSRSGVHHRLQKLIDLANELDKK